MANDTPIPEYTYNFAIENTIGEKVSSCYALPNDSIIFRPEADTLPSPNLLNHVVVWDFGDGNTRETLSGEYVYSTPGEYTITNYIYDEFGQAYKNTLEIKIVVFDFVESKIEIEVADDIEIVASRYNDSNPIKLKQYSSINYLNSDSPKLPRIILYPDTQTTLANYDYFRSGLAEETYGHLLPSYTFLQQLSTPGSGVDAPISVENVPVSAVNITDATSIYANNEDGIIVTYTDNDTNIPDSAVLAGLSGNANLLFSSDIAADFDLLMGLEQGAINNYTNTTTYGIKASVNENNTIGQPLGISSNGLEVPTLNTFDINPIKFACTNIAFVIKMLDEEGFPSKSLPMLSLDTDDASYIPLTATVTNGLSVFADSTDTAPDSNFLFSSDVGSLSSLLPNVNGVFNGGFFKGYVWINTEEVLEDVFITARVEYDGVIYTGVSTDFTIYPIDYYIVAKQGEDIDFKEAFEDIATQPLFTDSKVLMKDFLGTIFGDIESAQDSIGKGTYEKIQNFLDNNTIIDYANIDQLASILEMVDLPRINKYSFPPKIKRLIDLLSISQSRLFGDTNQNRDNFNSFGYQDNSCYGTDRCDKIPKEGVIVAGYDIVAFEKYSGRWKTLNTMLPLSASDGPFTGLSLQQIPKIGDNYNIIDDVIDCFPIISCVPIAYNVVDSNLQLETLYFNICIEGTYDAEEVFNAQTPYYSLSDYNSTWGWPLVPDRDGDIFSVYDFFYKAQYEKTLIEGSVINYNDENTTINNDYTSSQWNKLSYCDWARPNGLVSNIFSASLYSGLDLINCNRPIQESGLSTTVGEVNISMTKDILNLSDGPFKEGDNILYQALITNTGNGSLTEATLTDTLTPINIVAGTWPDESEIGAFRTLDIRYSYTVTIDDVINGSISNTACLTGTQIADICDTVIVTDFVAPSLSITKTEVSQGPYLAGDPISYRVDVTNNGGTIIGDIILTDTLSPINITSGVELFNGGVTIGVGQISAAEYSYTVTNPDEASGIVSNTACVNSPDSGLVCTSPLEITNIGVPALSISKIITSSGPYTVGQPIVYEVTVENNGTQTATDVNVEDTLFIDNSQIVNDPRGILTSNVNITPGEVITTQYQYIVTEDDVIAGSVINEACTVSSLLDVCASVEETDLILPPSSRCVIDDITLDEYPWTEPYSVGNILKFKMTIENNSDFYLYNVSTEEIKLSPVILLVDSDNIWEAYPGQWTEPGTGFTLGPGLSTYVEYEYIVTQEDVDFGSIEIESQHSYDQPSPDYLQTLSATYLGSCQKTLNVFAFAQMNGQVDISYDTTVITEGTVLTISYTWTNISPSTPTTAQHITTLSPINNINDPDDLINGSVSFAPLASKQISYQYTVTDTDIVAATGGGYQVVVPGKIDYDLGNGTISTFTADVTLEAFQPGVITVSKSEVVPQGQLYPPYAEGEPIAYEVVVSNTGDSPVTGCILSESLTPINVTSDPLGLFTGNTVAPNSSTTITYTYTVTETNITDETVINTAEVTSSVDTVNDTVTITDILSAGIVVEKEETSIGPYTQGDPIRYTVTVTNGGATTTDIVLSDSLGLSELTIVSDTKGLFGSGITLAPREDATVIYDYVIPVAATAPIVNTACVNSSVGNGICSAPVTVNDIV